MFNKIKKFIFASEDEYEEIEEKEDFPEIIINEENVTRKEVFYSTPQEEASNSIFVEVETEQVKEQKDPKDQDYRSYRQTERRERVKETRGEESDYIPRQIISPIFGMSEQKTISKKDVELNDYESVVAKPSSTKIISPMFGVNDQVATKAEETKNESSSKIETSKIEKNELHEEIVGKTQQFNLEELNVTEENNDQSVKTMILAAVNQQLEEQSEETRLQDEVEKNAPTKSTTTGGFGFAYRGPSHSETTVLMGKKSEA